MDFGSLLHEAQKNDKTNRNGANFYKTKFEPPKKESKSKSLSSNIQKFLAKKEEEERRKLDEAKRKREELLAMRDEKTRNKIKKSLKVIKSANKSVLDDAVDNNDTAVTLAGPDQPDEDDYGYVSQEASAFYSKMMEKYKSVPEDDKFSSSKKIVNHDLTGTKDRVKAAILRHQEEESMPHKRKRRTHANESPTDNDYYDDDKYVEEKKEEKPKPRKVAPPPLDFNELLKIAEKKQFEPVVIETKKPEVIEEPDRLMTKKQKREYEQYKAYKEAKMRREQERETNSKDSSNKGRPEISTKPDTQSKPSNPLSIRIPKIGERNGGDSKKSSLSNGNMHHSRDKERERPQSVKKEYNDSDVKYKRDESKHSEKRNDTYDDKRLSKTTVTKSSSHDDRLSKPSERSFKIPVNKSNPTSDRGRDNFHKNDRVMSNSTDRSSNSKSSSSANISKSNSVDRKDLPSKSVESKKSDQVVKKSLTNSSSSDKRVDRKPESFKQGSRPSQSEQMRMSNKPPSSAGDRNKLNKPSSDAMKSISKAVPDVNNKRTYLPGDIRYQKGVTDARSSKPQQPSSNLKQDIKQSSDVRNYRPDDDKASKFGSDARGPRPQVSDKGSRPQISDRGSKTLPTSGAKSSKLSASENKSSRPFPPSDVKGSRPAGSGTNGIRPGVPANTKAPRPFPPPDVKGSRQFPPPDVRGSRQFPPPDVRGPRQFPPRDTMSRNDRRPMKRQMIDDDDSEYDSELDDFIDDGPQDGNDYSKYIKEIFGYDKSKYKDKDEDVDNMESNFSQVMREEFISKKIGLMEDLEDMRMEALEKKKKMQKKRRRIDDDD